MTRGEYESAPAAFSYTADVCGFNGAERSPGRVKDTRRERVDRRKRVNERGRVAKIAPWLGVRSLVRARLA